MRENKRRARIWAIWSAGLLLAGLAAFLVPVILVFTIYLNQASRELQGDAYWMVSLVAPILLIASALTAMRAVAAGNLALEGGRKRSVLIWSSWYVALALALLLISTDISITLASPWCNQAPGRADACSWALTLPLVGTVALVGIPLVVAYVGAAIIGLFNMARSGKPGWFWAVLLYLIASVAGAVVSILVLNRPEPIATSDPILQAILLLLLVPPLLAPVLTLIYSLSSQRRAKPA